MEKTTKKIKIYKKNEKNGKMNKKKNIKIRKKIKMKKC